MKMNLIHKIHRFVQSLLHRPIRVFVFHHTSEVMDPLICEESDWTQVSVFHSNILHLQRQYAFISLQEAIEHLKQDKLRLKNYAVLTADDGLRSTYELLPWLIEHHIPITLFICPRYLNGYSYIPIDEQRVHAQFPNADMNEVAKRMFITPKQLASIDSPLVTIASHGYAHLDAASLSEQEFISDVLDAKNVIESHPLYKPFFAYPWGHHTLQTDKWLEKNGIVPVLCDGNKNRYWTGTISRECIDNKIIR